MSDTHPNNTHYYRHLDLSEFIFKVWVCGTNRKIGPKRNIVGLGIDTLSPDTPDSGYPVHQTILGAGKYIVENVANSSKLPPQGSFSLALPIRIEGGTEAPMRLVGLIPHEVKSHDQ